MSYGQLYQIAFPETFLFKMPGNQNIRLSPDKSQMFFAGFISGPCYFTTYWRPLESKTRTTMSRRFDLKCFCVSLKCRLPGKFHFTIFHQKKSIASKECTRSPDSKMIKRLKLDMLFSSTRHSRENSQQNDDDYHFFPPK